MFPSWQPWLEKYKSVPQSEMFLLVDLMLNSDMLLSTRMSYGVPFIYRLGPIGYFNIDKKRGLYFGFYWGKLLLKHDSSGILDPDDRKMVKLVYLKDRVNNEDFLGAFLALLDEAIRIDEQRYRKN